MNVVICAIAKNENIYINNWCNYYLNLGVSKIYLFDNNDKDTFFVGDFLDASIKSKIQIINKRDIYKQNLQLDCYNEFYSKYNNTFDWCIFIDIDEFIVGVKDINKWLSNPLYDSFEMVRLKWNLFGDDGVIERDMSIPVQKFFTKILKDKVISDQGKFIVKGGLENIHIGSSHYAFRGNKIPLKQCLPSGKKCNSKIKIIDDYSDEKIFLNHYMTKTLSEFIIQKYGRGDAVFVDRDINFEYFWQINEKTPVKLKYIEDMMGE